MTARETVEMFRDAARHIIDTYEYNEKMIQSLEHAVIDVTHEIEFSQYDVRRGFDAYKRLKEIVVERRRMKNENEVLRDAYDQIIADKTLMNRLNKSVGHARKCEEAQRTRKYYNKSTGTVLGDCVPMVSIQAIRGELND